MFPFPSFQILGNSYDYWQLILSFNASTNQEKCFKEEALKVIDKYRELCMDQGILDKAANGNYQFDQQYSEYYNKLTQKYGQKKADQDHKTNYDNFVQAYRTDYITLRKEVDEVYKNKFLAFISKLPKNNKISDDQLEILTQEASGIIENISELITRIGDYLDVQMPKANTMALQDCLAMKAELEGQTGAEGQILASNDHVQDDVQLKLMGAEEKAPVDQLGGE